MRLTTIGLAVLILLAGATEAQARRGRNRLKELTKNELVVRLAPGTDAQKFARDYRVKVISQGTGSGRYRVKMRNTRDAARLLAKRLQDTRIISADKNLPAPSPPGEQAQWTTAFDGDRGPRAYDGQLAIGQVRFTQAPTLADGAGVTVAVLDTGISRRHPHLAAQTVEGWNFVDDNADTDDRPYQLDLDGDRVRDEGLGHGTVVAGLIARFAPKATLLPVRVLNSEGMGTVWDAVRGIEYAISKGARVLNLSFGVQERSEILEDAIKEAEDAGVLIITTAGNHASSRPQYPAKYSHVVAVGAVNADDSRAKFSNFGSDVDIYAPGVDVVSTFWDGTYVAWSGTSFAAPMVSGTAALILSRNPGLSLEDVGDLIEDTARRAEAARSLRRGRGGDDGGNSGPGGGDRTEILDVDSAVTAAINGGGDDDDEDDD